MWVCVGYKLNSNFDRLGLQLSVTPSHIPFQCGSWSTSDQQRRASWCAVTETAFPTAPPQPRGTRLDPRGMWVDLRGMWVDLRGTWVDLRGTLLDLRGRQTGAAVKQPASPWNQV